MNPKQITSSLSRNDNYTDETSAATISGLETCTAKNDYVTTSSTLLYDNIIMMMRKENEQFIEYRPRTEQTKSYISNIINKQHGNIINQATENKHTTNHHDHDDIIHIIQDNSTINGNSNHSAMTMTSLPTSLSSSSIATLSSLSLPDCEDYGNIMIPKTSSSASSSLSATRYEMIEWLYEMIDVCQYNIQTFEVSVLYYDRCMNIMCDDDNNPIQSLYYKRIFKDNNINNNQKYNDFSHLVGIICFNIASKAQESNCITLKALLKKSSKKNYNYTMKQLISMEYLILSSLKYKLHPVTSISFLYYFIEMIFQYDSYNTNPKKEEQEDMATNVNTTGSTTTHQRSIMKKTNKKNEGSSLKDRIIHVALNEIIRMIRFHNIDDDTINFETSNASTIAYHALLYAVQCCCSEYHYYDYNYNNTEPERIFNMMILHDDEDDDDDDDCTTIILRWLLNFQTNNTDNVDNHDKTTTISVTTPMLMMAHNNHIIQDDKDDNNKQTNRLKVSSTVHVIMATEGEVVVEDHFDSITMTNSTIPLDLSPSFVSSSSLSTMSFAVVSE